MALRTVSLTKIINDLKSENMKLKKEAKDAQECWDYENDQGIIARGALMEANGENLKLKRQLGEAMTVLGFYADEDEHKSRNVDLDYGDRARALIAKHEAEKEKMKK